MLDKRYNNGLNSLHKINGKVFSVRRLVLDRLQTKFASLVERYMDENGLNQGELANQIGIQRTHLNLLLSGKRQLSAYYVFNFIRCGVFKVDQLYDGKSETAREKDFWSTAREAENIALLSRIAKLREKGIDVNGLLDMIDPDSK